VEAVARLWAAWRMLMMRCEKGFLLFLIWTKGGVQSGLKAPAQR